MKLAGKESESYAYQGLISHLVGAGFTARLFELVDDRGFLAAQADHFGDFGRTTEDMEAFLLPAVIAAEDWTRFVQYAAIAVNLRGLAEDLAEPEILTALARTGRGKLAHDAASRITDPRRRAAARAVLAAEQRGQEEIFRQMLETIERDLEAPLSPASEEEIRRRAELLAGMARCLGPDLESWWPTWIENAGLTDDEAGPVWRAVAESWLDQGNLAAPGLWQALREIPRPEDLLAFLPERLGALADDDAENLLERLRSMFQDEGDRHRATMSFLARLADRHEEAAIAIWERWNDAEDILWTAELVDVGNALFAKFEQGRLDILIAKLSDPVTAAALRVVALEAALSGDREQMALDAIEKISNDAEKLHWALRYLRACPGGSTAETRGRLASIARYLHESRYNAPPGDIRLYLDLIARLFPERLSDQIESIVLSPTCRETTLLAIASEADTPEVVEKFLKDAPAYVKMVSPSESEYFRLRRNLLLRGAYHACTLRGSFPKDLPALLRDEEDELRSTLVSAPSLRVETALQICGGIRDRRLELLTRLRIARHRNVPISLDPSGLYSAFVRTERLDDELLALTCLLTPPTDPSSLIRQIHNIRTACHRILTLLNIGWSCLRHQAGHSAQHWDPREIIEMIRPEMMIEDHKVLVSLLPEIAALGAQVGGKSAVAEVCEAVELTATFTTVPWPLRLNTIERILSSIPVIFLSLTQPSEAKAARLAHDALYTIALLPIALEPGSALDQLSEHWHEVLPMIAAATDRLPQGLNSSVQRAIAQGLPKRASASMLLADRIYSSCQAGLADRARTAIRLLKHD